MESLVTTDWLARHLDDPDLVVLDCSVRTEQDAQGPSNFSGLEDYATGHIPGAAFADLTGDLSATDSQIEFALPRVDDFCRALGKLGVGDDSRVVLYDNSYSAWAARVWWMLRWIGFDRAAVLNGGLSAWKDEGRPLSTDTSARPRRHLTPHARPEVVAMAEEVLAAIDDPAITVIDTLPHEFYAGEVTIYERPGHIPSALNIPATGLLNPDGRFVSDDEMAKVLALPAKGRKITYCGGGILASLAAFALVRLGHDDVAVYAASLQEWAADPEKPMEISR